MIICPGCCSPDWWRRVVVRREAGGERREAGGERREARGGKNRFLLSEFQLMPAASIEGGQGEFCPGSGLDINGGLLVMRF